MPTAPAPAVEPLPSGDRVVAQPSEHVAQGKPDPNCHDCKRADAQGGPVYHGDPEMKLDEATLADVRTTIQDTCDLLAKGVDILEAHVKRPEKASKALLDYLKTNKIEIDRVFHRADEVRARLRVAGYDQDIPVEVQPEFEERMGAIQARLEKMRRVYRDRPEVLAAFGGFFPRKR